MKYGKEKRQKMDISLTLDRVNSHYIGGDFSSADTHSKEEAYPEFTGVIRGKERRIKCEASRYQYSGGNWSDWRIFPRDIEPSDGIGEATRAEIRPVIERLTLAWIDGTLGTAESGPKGKYPVSRRRAFAYFVKSSLTERHYSRQSLYGRLEACKSELSPADYAELSFAAGSLWKAMLHLDNVPSDNPPKYPLAER